MTATTKHTNADFYTGLGRDAVWIGSLGAHADPVRLATDTLPGGRALLKATSETDYRAAFDELARHWDDQYLGVVYRPQGEWPMTWVNSTLVGYRYALGDGRVWICGPDDAGRWWTTTGRHGPDDRPAALTEVHYYYGFGWGSLAARTPPPPTGATTSTTSEQRMRSARRYARASPGRSTWAR